MTSFKDSSIIYNISLASSSIDTIRSKHGTTASFGLSIIIVATASEFVRTSPIKNEIKPVSAV